MTTRYRPGSYGVERSGAHPVTSPSRPVVPVARGPQAPAANQSSRQLPPAAGTPCVQSTKRVPIFIDISSPAIHACGYRFGIPTRSPIAHRLIALTDHFLTQRGGEVN